MTRPSKIAVVAAALICLVVLTCSTVCAEPRKKSLIVMPVFNGLSEDKAQLANDLVVLLKDALSLTERFLVLSYDPGRSVSVQRAVTEQRMRAEDAASAFKTDEQGVAKAQRLCRSIGADLCVVGSLDSYRFDDTTKSASIGLTVKVLAAEAKGEPVTAVVTGAASGNVDDQSQSESGIAIAALDDAAEQALSGILADPTMLPAAPAVSGGGDSVSANPKSRDKGFIHAMFGALLLGLMLGGK